MSATFGQEKTFQPKASLSVDAGIPTKNKNVSFGNVMEGLFNGGFTYQYNVFKGLTLGAGAKYSYFNINTFALNNTSISGGLHMPAVFGQIGYERFTTDRISFNFSVRAGYAVNISANDSCKINRGESHVEMSGFVEPQFEALLLTEKNSSNGFSFVLRL